MATCAQKGDPTRTALITDSSACLTPTTGRAVHVLPLRIRLVDDEVEDGLHAAERVTAAIDRGEAVKTCPPTPADYLLAIEWSGADQALIVTPAGNFTVMHHNAVVAARHTRTPVRVVDSRTAASGQGLVVAAAVRALQAGAGLEGTRSAALRAAARVDLVAALGSFDVLGRTGVVPAPALSVVAHEGAQALFRLREGTVEPLLVSRDVPEALDRMAQLWEDAGGERAEHTTVMHAGRQGDADRLADRIGVGTPVVAFSAAMAVHTGAGVVGLACLRP